MTGIIFTKSLQDKKFIDFETIELIRGQPLTEADEHFIFKKAMKLAKDCCAGDDGHRRWIMRKFGKVNRNTSKIHYLYDKNKKRQKKYAAAFKIKRKRKFSLTCDGKFFPPKPCPQNRECENIIPLTWISCQDKPPLHIVVNETPSLLVQMKKKQVHKVKFCQTDKKLCLIFLMIYLCSKYNSEHFIMNCYQTKSNYEFLTEVGSYELRLRMRGAEHESAAMTICGINLELPVDCDYINLPKNKLAMAQALIMYPTIEDFFIENDTIVSEKTKSLLKNINACYMHVLKNTGFFSSLSTDYLISQLLYFRGKYKLGNKFSADFEEFVQENSTSGVADDLTKLSNEIFDAGKNVTIPTQPRVFIDGKTAIQLLPAGKTNENLKLMKKDIRLTLLTKDEEELERLLPEIKPQVQIALRQLTIILKKFEDIQKVTPKKFENIKDSFLKNISIIDEQLKKLNGKQTSETKIFENKKTECIDQFKGIQLEYNHKNELVELNKIGKQVDDLKIDANIEKINKGLNESIDIEINLVNELISTVSQKLNDLENIQTIFTEEKSKNIKYCKKTLVKLKNLLSYIHEKEKEKEEQNKEILEEKKKLEKEDLLENQDNAKKEEITSINDFYSEELKYFYTIKKLDQKDFLIKSIEDINTDIAYYENNENNYFSAESINEIKKLLLFYQQKFLNIENILAKIEEFEVFLQDIDNEIKSYTNFNAKIEDFIDKLNVDSVIKIDEDTKDSINENNLQIIKDQNNNLKTKLKSLKEFLSQNNEIMSINDTEKNNLIQKFEENISLSNTLIKTYKEFLNKIDFLHKLSIKIKNLNINLKSFESLFGDINNILLQEDYQDVENLILRLNENKKNVLLSFNEINSLISANQYLDSNEENNLTKAEQNFLKLSPLLDIVEQCIDTIQQDNEKFLEKIEQGKSLIILFSESTDTPVYNIEYFNEYKKNIDNHRKEKDNKITEYKNKIEEIHQKLLNLSNELQVNAPNNLIILKIYSEIQNNLDFLKEKYNKIIEAYEYFFTVYDEIYTTDNTNIQESLNTKPLDKNIETFNTFKDSLGRSAMRIPSIGGSTTAQSERSRAQARGRLTTDLFAPLGEPNKSFEEEKAKYRQITASVQNLLRNISNENIPEIKKKIFEAKNQANLIKNNFFNEFNKDNDIKNSDITIQIFNEKLEKIKTNLILNEHTIEFSKNIDEFKIAEIPATPYTNISLDNISCPVKIKKEKLNSCTDEMWKGHSNNGFFDSFLFATFATDGVSEIFIPILTAIGNKYKPLYDAFVGYLNLHNESNNNNYSICKQKYINIIYNCLHEIAVQYKNDNTQSSTINFYNNTLFDCLQKYSLEKEENMSTSNFQCLFFFFELANFQLRGRKNFYNHYTLTNIKNILKEKEQDDECECIASIVSNDNLSFLLDNNFEKIELEYATDTSKFILYSIIVQKENNVAAFGQALCNLASGAAEYNYFYYNNGDNIPKIKIDNNTKLGDKFQFTSATLIFTKVLEVD